MIPLFLTSLRFSHKIIEYSVVKLIVTLFIFGRLFVWKLPSQFVPLETVEQCLMEEGKESQSSIWVISPRGENDSQKMQHFFFLWWSFYISDYKCWMFTTKLYVSTKGPAQSQLLKGIILTFNSFSTAQTWKKTIVLPQ